MTRVHYRDAHKPVAVVFTFPCQRCGKDFKAPGVQRVCFACRAEALKHGAWDPEHEAEMSGT